MEAQNCFHSGIGVETMKCAQGFNYHGERKQIMNKGLISNECSRCDEIEDWHCAVKCKVIVEMKEEFINKMKQKLPKKLSHITLEK